MTKNGKQAKKISRPIWNETQIEAKRSRQKFCPHTKQELEQTRIFFDLNHFNTIFTVLPFQNQPNKQNLLLNVNPAAEENLNFSTQFFQTLI